MYNAARDLTKLFWSSRQNTCQHTTPPTSAVEYNMYQAQTPVVVPSSQCLTPEVESYLAHAPAVVPSSQLSTPEVEQYHTIIPDIPIAPTRGSVIQDPSSNQEYVKQRHPLPAPSIILRESTENYAEWKYDLETTLMGHGLLWVIEKSSQSQIERHLISMSHNVTTVLSPLQQSVMIVHSFLKRSIPYILVKRHKWDVKCLTPFHLFLDVQRLYGDNCEAVRANRENQERHFTFASTETLSTFLDRHQNLMDDLSVLDAIWDRDRSKLKSLFRILRKRADWQQIIETLALQRLNDLPITNAYAATLETLRKIEIQRHESGIGANRNHDYSPNTSESPRHAYAVRGVTRIPTQDQCTVHPHGRHTNSECRKQHTNTGNNSDLSTSRKRKMAFDPSLKRPKTESVSANFNNYVNINHDAEDSSSASQDSK